MDRLTHNLNEMIRNQRLAELATDANEQEYRHREAMRHRAAAHKLDRQIKTTRQSVAGWMNLN